jgi:hypothetical protein
MTYGGCLPTIVDLVKIMFVRGMGIEDVSTILKIRITTVLKVPKSTKYQIKPKRNHYGCLEIDRFWTYVRNKKNKVWPHIRLSPGKRGNCGICVGERGSENGTKIEKRIKR